MAYNYHALLDLPPVLNTFVIRLIVPLLRERVSALFPSKLFLYKTPVDYVLDIYLQNVAIIGMVDIYLVVSTKKFDSVPYAFVILS